MVIMLSNSSFIFASGGTDEAVTASQENSQQDVQDTQTETFGTSTETEVSVRSETATLSETQETEATPTPETTPEPTAESTATPTPETTTVPEVTGNSEESVSGEYTETIGEQSEESKNIEFPAFLASYTTEDGSATVSVNAAEGVFPADVTFTARKIAENSEEYTTVEKHLEANAQNENTDLLDFVAYDITFFDGAGNEIEPDGEVNVSIEFNHEIALGGMKENENLSVVHVKDDFSTEEVENNITAENNVVQNASFTASDFSIYAITTSGDLEEYTGEITSTYATIEFWDREDADNTIYLSNQKPNTGNSYKVTINVYVDGNREERFTNYFLYNSSRSDLTDSNDYGLRTTVKPGDGYYFAQQCEWLKGDGQGDSNHTEFTGSGSTGVNGNNINHTLNIYLTEQVPQKNDIVVQNTSPISVELYNYDSDAYNEYVGVNSNSLLLRSEWNTTYKADGYGVSGNNAHNESCGRNGIYFGLASMEAGNIDFGDLEAAFFDDDFDQANQGNQIGTKYDNVSFMFQYDESTRTYSYDSDENHVHFDEETNILNQYEGAGPETASDGEALEKTGFFPFTDETDNMTDYGFGMRMDVEFYLTSDGKIEGTGQDMEFSFSGDDDVWVFIDGELVLDLGGLHARRGGTINFATGQVTYDDAPNNYGPVGPVEGTVWPQRQFNFEKGASHTLTMYYLERGGSDSNCEISFNLQLLPGQLTVEKEIDQTIDNPDILYDFIVKDSNGEVVTNAEYTVNNVEYITDSETGVFQLKAGEEAIFSSLLSGTYTVEEQATRAYTTSWTITGDNVAQSGEGDSKTTTAFTLRSGTETKVTFTNSKTDISELIHQSKTATYTGDFVQDPEAGIINGRRTYDINISAWAEQYASQVESTKNYDIVLVIDRSLSMNDLDLDYNEAQRVSFDNLIDGGLYYIKRYSSEKHDSMDYILVKWDSEYNIFYDWADPLTGIGGSSSLGAQEPSSYQLTMMSGNASTYNNVYTQSEVRSRNDGNFVYTGTSRLDRVQSAAKSFVESLSVLSPNSRVAIVAYSGGAYRYSGANANAMIQIGLTTVGSGTTQINGAIDEIIAGGATQMQYGLDRAYDILSNSSDNEKIVIMFNDGDITGGVNGDNANQTRRIANELREIATIYASAFYGSEVNQDTASSFLAELTGDSERVTILENADDILHAFDGIIEEIEAEPVVATIRDYIDPRFDVLTVDGTQKAGVDCQVKLTRFFVES